ncbi:MAG: endonuclease Q family protein [Patescibacteria group bacterium]
MSIKDINEEIILIWCLELRLHIRVEQGIFYNNHFWLYAIDTMRYYADLHIHSKYSRACSPKLTLENIDLWCRIKGISIVSCGDFTHPKWFQDIQEKLESEGNGLYRLKPSLRIKDFRFKEKKINDVHFIISTELSCIYKHAGAVRRVHHCVFLPSLEAAAKLNNKLMEQGRNLKADGRPILGLSSQELLKLLLEVDERSVLIPAHAWTPWFAIFGSKSGYNSIEECFGDLSKHVFAIETGLSSDPAMNWRLSKLDQVALVSHSDAHSLPNIGREADIFEGSELSYDNIMKAIKRGNPEAVVAGEDKLLPLKFTGTIEFFPDEGRYHFDGHRDCKIRLHPTETIKRKGVCPTCGRELTLGVLYRVNELADRDPGFKPNGASLYISLIELDKVIAQAQGVKGRQAKAVEAEYWNLVSYGGGELQTLLDVPEDELSKITTTRVVEAIQRLRWGKVSIEPGYDGIYGIIDIFNTEEKIKQPQASLF